MPLMNVWDLEEEKIDCELWRARRVAEREIEFEKRTRRIPTMRGPLWAPVAPPFENPTRRPSPTIEGAIEAAKGSMRTFFLSAQYEIETVVMIATTPEGMLKRRASCEV